MLEAQSRVLVAAATSQPFRRSARRAGDLGRFQKARTAALTEESAKDRAATWAVHTQRPSRAPQTRYPSDAALRSFRTQQKAKARSLDASFAVRQSRSVPEYSWKPSCAHYGQKRATLGLSSIADIVTTQNTFGFLGDLDVRPLMTR